MQRITGGWRNDLAYSTGCSSGPQLAAPFQSFGCQELYPDGLEKIARAAYGLAANHPFLDGNKRIGAMTMQLLLQWNGYRLSLRTGELADRFISIAAGDGNCEELLAWIRAHLAP